MTLYASGPTMSVRTVLQMLAALVVFVLAVWWLVP